MKSNNYLGSAWFLNPEWGKYHCYSREVISKPCQLIRFFHISSQHNLFERLKYDDIGACPTESFWFKGLVDVSELLKYVFKDKVA